MAGLLWFSVVPMVLVSSKHPSRSKRPCLTLTGFQISRAFALEGCHVIMVNRKEEQGTESIEDVKKEKADAKIEWEGCDLGNLKEVKQVFEGIRQKLDRLDIVSTCHCIKHVSLVLTVHASSLPPLASIQTLSASTTTASTATSASTGSVSSTP